MVYKGVMLIKVVLFTLFLTLEKMQTLLGFYIYICYDRSN